MAFDSGGLWAKRFIVGLVVLPAFFVVAGLLKLLEWILL